MEEKSFMLVKKGRIMKKVNGIKGKKALGVLISNGAVTLLGYVVGCDNQVEMTNLEMITGSQ